MHVQFDKNLLKQKSENLPTGLHLLKFSSTAVVDGCRIFINLWALGGVKLTFCFLKDWQAALLLSPIQSV